MNMILGEVEETITTVEIDDETYEEIIKVFGGSAGACRAGCRSGRLQTSAMPGFAALAIDLLLQPLHTAYARELACHVVHMQTQRRSVPFLFVRGDGVILVWPPLRS